MTAVEVAAPFGVALGVGALVGLERQRSLVDAPEDAQGGVRTFPLAALLGCLAAFLSRELGPSAFVALAAAHAVVVALSYWATASRGSLGLTTELALLLTFGLGALPPLGHSLLAAGLAVVVTGLLSLKRELHEWTTRLERADLYAALKLGTLTLVALPLLPDESFGPEPYRLFNPAKVWRLVVLIAAIGFAGYVGVKALGPGRGIVVAGGLGGLVSSTAVTLSFAGRSKEVADLARPLAVGIAVAWATMFVRVLVAVAVVDRAVLGLLFPAVGGALVAGVGGAGLVWWRSRGEQVAPGVAHANPFSLSAAFKFGALFTVILFVAKFAQLRFADAGVLAAAALAGTVDVDAMTLSLADLASKGELPARTAALGIGVTLASNTVVKAGIAASIGAPALRRALLPIVAATLAAGAVAGALAARA